MDPQSWFSIPALLSALLQLSWLRLQEQAPSRLREGETMRCLGLWLVRASPWHPTSLPHGSLLPGVSTSLGVQGLVRDASPFAFFRKKAALWQTGFCSSTGTRSLGETGRNFLKVKLWLQQGRYQILQAGNQSPCCYSEQYELIHLSLTGKTGLDHGQDYVSLSSSPSAASWD